MPPSPCISNVLKDLYEKLNWILQLYTGLDGILWRINEKQDPLPQPPASQVQKSFLTKHVTKTAENQTFNHFFKYFSLRPMIGLWVKMCLFFLSKMKINAYKAILRKNGGNIDENVHKINFKSIKKKNKIRSNIDYIMQFFFVLC